MGKWSESRNGNLRNSANRESSAGTTSSPRNSRRGCLCANRRTYSVGCCKGALSQQGIGNILSPNSDGGTLRLSNISIYSGIYLGPTEGRSVPMTSERGCLCVDSDTYSVRCCQGYLVNQGIGKTQSPFKVGGGFSDGYDEGFDIEE